MLRLMLHWGTDSKQEISQSSHHSLNHEDEVIVFSNLYANLYMNSFLARTQQQTGLQQKEQ